MKRNTIDRLIARVRRTITEHDMIEENEHIVIGLSGGPDSVCLFDIEVEIGRASCRERV